MSGLPSPQISFQEVAHQILATRRITRADQNRFMMAAFAKDALSRDEQLLVDQVFEALKRGLVKVVD